MAAVANMNEAAPQSPATSARAGGNGDPRASIDRPCDFRYDEAPLPTPPATSTPAVAQDSPRTAFDTSELRERVDGVLQSDVSVDKFSSSTIAHGF
jgi:hypothetical protein